jgi:threonine/homoserine/homoserine lactone efflux protein
MTAGSLLVFGGAILIAGLVPGPAVMTVLARVLARGPRGIAPFCVGLLLGDLLWLSAAALGLAMVAERAAFVLRGLTCVGALYLLVIAHGFWTAPTTPPAAPAHPVGRARSAGRGLAQGLLLQIGNPKVMLFYVALLPALIPLGRLTALDLALLALVVTCSIAVTNAVYIVFAVAVRRYVESPGALRGLHRFSAIVMAVAAGFLAWSASQG